MKIFVTAKPNASRQSVEKIDDTHFVVSVKEPPVRGRANRAIIELLALYFHVAAGRVRLVSGFASPKKIIEVFF